MALQFARICGEISDADYTGMLTELERLYETEETVDFTVYIPKTDTHFAASLAVIPLQLLGYYVSVAKVLDVDQPRNLAKSVTVE